jgi:aryl-alcohol dehydrogenase-like predicted oxidoreductase
MATNCLLETRRIGSLEVTVVGLGCNNFGGRLDEAVSEKVIHAAIEAGINFLDTADIYGGTMSEEFMGRALEGHRDKVLIATKFGHEVAPDKKGASPEYVKLAVEESLRRLKTDHIDLYQLHRPDDNTPIADTLGALNELVQAGKVREIGCSNFSPAQLIEAKEAAGTGAKFVSVQNHYNLLHRSAEAGAVVEAAREGLAFLPYFPLASGLLSGKYRKGQPLPEGTRISKMGHFAGLLENKNLEVVESLIEFAQLRQHTILDLAFAWLLSQPVVASVIAGATSPEQIRANVASGSWRLSTEELEEVNSIVGDVEV